MSLRNNLSLMLVLFLLGNCSGSQSENVLQKEKTVFADSIPFMGMKSELYERKEYGGLSIAFDVYYRNHIERKAKYALPAHLLAAYMVADTKEGLAALYEENEIVPNFGFKVRNKIADPNFYKNNYFVLHYVFDIDREYENNGRYSGLVFTIVKGNEKTTALLLVRYQEDGSCLIVSSDKINYSDYLPFLIDKEILRSFKLKTNVLEGPLAEIYNLTRYRKDSQFEESKIFDFRKLIQLCNEGGDSSFSSTCSDIFLPAKPITHESYWTELSY